MSISLISGHSDEVINQNLLALLTQGLTWSKAVSTCLEMAGRNISEFDDYLTEDLDNRLLFAVGTFNGIDITIEDLQDIVEAYHELESICTPNIKITHKEYDEHENHPILYDFPFKFGEVKNLRIINNQLFGDMKNIPKKIARLVKNGMLPKLSVEIYRNLETPNLGEPYKDMYPCFLDAVALLGSEREALFEVMQSYGFKDCDIKKVLNINVYKSNQNPETFSGSGEKVIFEFSKEKKNKMDGMDEKQVKTLTESIKDSISSGFQQVVTLFKKEDEQKNVTPEVKESFSKEDVQNLINDAVKGVSSTYQVKIDELTNVVKEQTEQFSKLQNKSSQDTDSMRFEKLNRESKLPRAMNEAMLSFCVDLDKIENHTKQFNLKFSFDNKEVTLKEKFMQILETLPSLPAYSTNLFSKNNKAAEITHQDVEKFGSLQNNQTVDNQLDLQAYAKSKNLKFETTKDKRIAAEQYYEETGIVV